MKKQQLYHAIADEVRGDTRIRTAAPALRLEEDGREVAIITLSGYKVGDERTPNDWARRLKTAHNSHDDLVKYAQRVMDALAAHGPSIVPHLMDTDDNDGERLRQALRAAITL